jgi:tyrosyl-DNA phosphodiesterase 2
LEYPSLSRAVARSELILDHVFKGPKFPVIIFIQEVASSVRQSLPSDPRVRSSFLTTDAEYETSFKGVPFATMTLLSSRRFGSPLLAEGEGEGEDKRGPKMVRHSVFRTRLPSRYKRDALWVNIAAPAVPGAVLRLLNVHLDTLESQFSS